jgi:hypothetical protein
VADGILAEKASGSDAAFYVMFPGSGLNGVPTTIYLGSYQNVDLASNHLTAQTQPFSGDGGIAFSFKGISLPAGSCTTIRFYVGVTMKTPAPQPESACTGDCARRAQGMTVGWRPSSGTGTTKGSAVFVDGGSVWYWYVYAQAYTPDTTPAEVNWGVTITAIGGSWAGSSLHHVKQVTLTVSNPASAAVTVDVAVWGDTNVGDQAFNVFSTVADGIVVEKASGSAVKFYVMFPGSGLNGVPSTKYLGYYEDVDDPTYHLTTQNSYSGNGGIAFSFKGICLPAGSNKTITFLIGGTPTKPAAQSGTAECNAGPGGDDDETTSRSAKKPVPVAAIVGGVYGGLVLIVIVMTAFLCCTRPAGGGAKVGNDEAPPGGQGSGAPAPQQVPGSQPVKPGQMGYAPQQQPGAQGQWGAA